MAENISNVFSIFDDQQWKSFQKLIASHHSKEGDVYKIFEYYKGNKDQLHKLPPIDKIREKKFAHIKHKRFLNLLSVLNGHTEDFLVLDYMKSNELKKNILLNKIYNDNGLFTKADQKARKIQKLTENQEKLSLVKHQILAKIFHQQYYSDNPTKYKNGTALLENLVSHEMIKAKTQLLLYKCELHNWGRMKQYDYSDQIEAIHQLSQAIPPSILSRYLEKLEQLIVSPDLENYMFLRSALYDEKFQQPSDLHTIFTMYLLNASIKLWHKNIYKDAEANAILFEYALNSGVLMYNGKIPVIRFHNLIATLGSLKSFKWTHEFILRWKEKLAGKSIRSTANLAHAQNAFIYEKYDHIIPLIRGMEFEHFNQKVTALGLELIVLFIERRENYGLLRNFIDNFKRTLKRNKTEISENMFKSHTNLIKVIELLVKRDFTRVTIHLGKYDFLIYRSWLQKQI